MGDRKGRPYGVSSTSTVGSANSGAEVEPHQRQFLQTQGPVARKESQKATQILRAGNIARPDRYASPVVGAWGPTPPVRGRCREATKGVGRANMSAERSS